MRDHDIEKYRAAAVDAINAAFEAGRLQGAAEERRRVKALLDADLAPSRASSPRRASATPQRSYGNVLSVVRPALRDIGEAIDAPGMTMLIGGAITRDQCRNALRQLVRNGEAISVTRGKFLWRGASESPAAENPDADTSGYSVAAE